MSLRLRHIATVSGATFASRISGLLRDVFIYAQLGAGLLNSAFIIAFTIPNLFRRLLGEGALSSAVVPVFSGVLSKADREGAFAFFNRVITRLASLLIVISLIVMGVAGMTLLFTPPDQNRARLGLELGILLFPYVIPVCLAAIFAAGLNVLRHFAVPAVTPILLNLCMIAVFAFGIFVAGASGKTAVIFLSLGVLFGGALQLLAPAAVLWRYGWRPHIDFSADPALTRLWQLFLPALAGAAILQVNLLVSRGLAYGLSEEAVSLLYLASRLIEMPLGMFTIAVATVVFPVIAGYFASGDHAGFRHAFREGLMLIMAISLPAAVGLVFAGRPILSLLFEWGAFTAEDVRRTVPVLAVYALGLPLYSAATLYTRALHAAHDMRTPARIAGWNLLINLILSLLLMVPLGVSGLALANVLAALCQTLLLRQALLRHGLLTDHGYQQQRQDLRSMCIALLLLIISLILILLILPAPAGKGALSMQVALIVGLPAGIYLTTLLGFDFLGFRSKRGLFARKNAR